MNNPLFTVSVSLLISLLAPQLLNAADHAEGQLQACKSVDSAGNVTYSDCKATSTSDDAKPVEVNTNQNILRVERPTEYPRDTAVIERQNRRDDRADAIEKAKAQLQAAQTRYEDSQKIRSGDYLGRKDGGMRPSSQRMERINAAKAAVVQAQSQLDALLE